MAEDGDGLLRNDVFLELIKRRERERDEGWTHHIELPNESIDHACDH